MVRTTSTNVFLQLLFPFAAPYRVNEAEGTGSEALFALGIIFHIIIGLFSAYHSWQYNKSYGYHPVWCGIFASLSAVFGYLYMLLIMSYRFIKETIKSNGDGNIDLEKLIFKKRE